MARRTSELSVFLEANSEGVLMMSPLAVAQTAWLERCARYRGDECKIWPFARTTSGYAKTTRLEGRKQYLAHRWICEKINGPAPSPKHEVSHSCGMGHIGCVTPRHLSWKTPSENRLEKRRHGTAWIGGNKLVPEQVKKIRSIGSGMTQQQIATLFGISQSNVCMILTGKTWTVSAPELGYLPLNRAAC